MLLATARRRRFAQALPEQRQLLLQVGERDVDRAGNGGDPKVVRRPDVEQEVGLAAVEQPLLFPAGDPDVLREQVQARRRLHHIRWTHQRCVGF